DWVFEINTGQIESSVVISEDVQATWEEALSTYTVSNTNDSGAGSLRQAIIDANASAGTDNIFFDISDALVGGAHTISLLSALPDITETVVIDGTQDSDFSGTPVVVIDGNGLSAAGLTLDTGSSGSTIHGLIIRDFSGTYSNGAGIYITNGSSGNTITGNWIGQFNADGSDAGASETTGWYGITVEGGNNTIGGTTAADRNVIVDGIYFYSSNANNNTVSGNYIGTDTTGNAVLASGNGSAGVVGTNSAHSNTIGGSTDAHRNIFGGLTHAIDLQDSSTDSYTIQNNWIGLGADGTTVLGNGTGIYLYDGDDNTIGGVGTGNVILGSTGTAIELIERNDNNVIQGNYIGIDETGSVIAGNNIGISIQWDSINNTIGGINPGEGNIITASTGAGISTDTRAGTAGNSFLGNSIYANGGLGIDLNGDGVTTNDTNDADTGANNLQNFPVITAAATAGSQIEISGTLDTNGLNKDYRIEFFATGTPDGTGYGQAERYLGYTTITTDGSGDATFTATIEALVYVGEEVTATATVDNGGGSYGDTSEFAANFTATAATNDAPTFMPLSADGKVITAIGSGSEVGRSVTMQDDGKILVAGYSNNGSNDDLALTRYNTDGSLDTTFDGDGTLTTAIGSSTDRGYGVVVQDDGKILVSGYSHNGSDNDFVLIRYNTDGTLDTSFDADGNNDGIVITPIGSGDDSSFAVSVQSDGKILVAGKSNNANTDFALVRYNTDGSLDTSFDADGIVTTDFGFGYDVGLGLMVQGDGKILVAGRSYNGSNDDFALARYNTDGSLDTSFDGDGMLITPIGTGSDYPEAATLQSDGKILVVGLTNGSDDDFALVRYNTDGSLDTSFDADNDGIVITPIGSGNDKGRAVTVQSDGKILVAGESHNGSNYDFALVRYNADGSLDNSFDTDGKVTMDFGSGNDTIYGITVQSDGKILVAGSSNNGSNNDFALVRYNADGSLDTTFDEINTLNGTPTFTEGGAAVVLDADVEIRDLELDALNGGLGNYDGASVTLGRNGG
ncbi:MAG: hypothetical protein GY935_23435, partial [Gammaproteobacteria bacterium]|nr:hypothetical protein [Gammaproteobacteria bacterium]